MIVVCYKGLKEEIEKMGEMKLCFVFCKIFRVDDSEEEVILLIFRKVKEILVVTFY